MSHRPRLLDLFAGAGGAAMGYHRAGFEVVGVDIKPQPRYPFEFHQADALTFPVQGFQAIHASPPCQRYSTLRHLPWLKGREYWDSIPPTRAFLQASGLPWLIENVEFAPLCGIILCGTMFGLPIYRHRRFEASFLLMAPDHEKHQVHYPKRDIVDDDGVTRKVSDLSRVNASRSACGGQHILMRELYDRSHCKDDKSRLNTWGETGIAGRHGGVALKRAAMGIDWMTGAELSQAIPPAYTEWIGRQLMRWLREARCDA